MVQGYVKIKNRNEIPIRRSIEIPVIELHHYGNAYAMYPAIQHEKGNTLDSIQLFIYSSMARYNGQRIPSNSSMASLINFLKSLCTFQQSSFYHIENYGTNKLEFSFPFLVINLVYDQTFFSIFVLNK